MARALSACLKRRATATKRADEAEQKPLEGVEEEAAMGRYQKMRFLSNRPCVLAVFKDAVTCFGVSVLEDVQKPSCLCTKVGGLTPIEPRWGHDKRTVR